MAATNTIMPITVYTVILLTPEVSTHTIKTLVTSDQLADATQQVTQFCFED